MDRLEKILHDRYRKRYQAGRGDQERIRGRIAVEAARRVRELLERSNDGRSIADISGDELYSAKRKAAAVLGHRVRPGDLPSDSEVRKEFAVLARDPRPRAGAVEEPPEPEGELLNPADHLDRFTIYKLLLVPLEAIKQSPVTHPEGDALYHSLQVYELAKSARPNDEEFQTAALLHDIGKAIDPANPGQAGARALEGVATARTLRLIAGMRPFRRARDKTLPPSDRKDLESREDLEDLALLSELDLAGRIAGASVPALETAIDELKALDSESAYLEI